MCSASLVNLSIMRNHRCKVFFHHALRYRLLCEFRLLLSIHIRREKTPDYVEEACQNALVAPSQLVSRALCTVESESGAKHWKLPLLDLDFAKRSALIPFQFLKISGLLNDITKSLQEVNTLTVRKNVLYGNI